MHRSGRHFLQIPGPTNTPDRVLRAMAQPTIDHRSAEFAALGRAVLDGLASGSSRPSGPVVIFPSSGTGAWEAALVNTLSPGDRVLAFDIGEFSQGLGRGRAAAGARRGDRAGRLAARRRSGSARGEAERGPRPSHPRRAGRPQRDVDRRDQPPAGDPRARSIAPAIRRCCSSMRSRHSAPSISATTSGASTSRWPDRRRD